MYSPGATIVGPAGAVVPPARALALAAARALALAAAGAVVAPAGAVQSRATAKQDADWLVGRSVGWLVGWLVGLALKSCMHQENMAQTLGLLCTHLVRRWGHEGRLWRQDWRRW